MAILLEGEKKKMNWMPIGIVAALLAIVFASTYYLFFTPEPFIEVIAPAAIKEKTQISSINLTQNISDLQKEKTLTNLREKVPSPTTGTLGRSNPFLVF